LTHGLWPKRVIEIGPLVGHDEIPRTPGGVVVVNRLSLAHRHDPNWDLDGRAARRSRIQRRLIGWGVRLVVLLALAVLVTRLPAIDASILTAPEAKPILAAAVLSLLAAFTLLAISRIRSSNPG
jgi:hypothetical protein